MAQFTPHVIEEGPNHITLQVNLLSDGSGELLATPVWSPTQCTPPLLANRMRFIIREIWYGLVWFDVTIQFGSLVPKTVWTLARDCDSHTNFTRFGGLPRYPEVPPVNDTGEILFTTNGFGTAGSRGTIVLDMRKIGP